VLKEAFENNLWGIVFFGSRARGEGKSYSDWDILILADGVPENPVDRTIFLSDLFFKKGVRGISPILRTKEEFENNLRPLYLDIAWDGIILFERAGYVKSKINEVKEIIEKAGLQRKRKNEGWVWEWARPTKPGAWKIEWKR